MSTELPPEALWRAIERTHDAALAGGALQPIATSARVVPDGGVDFVVRLAEGLAFKPTRYERGPAQQAPRRDPFADPEPALTVGEVSPTHRCLLNKYPVVARHALLVTRAFEDQESALSAADFAALAAGLSAFDALGFYNSGPESGASQRHKHLQLVPLPLDGGATGVSGVPMRAALGDALSPRPARVARLPFEHRAVALEPAAAAPDAARAMHAHYLAMLDAMGLSALAPAPYNLLATRSWMLLVPRRAEEAAGVEINGLGFAGAMFARDEAALERIVRLGPMRMLAEVARSPGL